MKLHHPFPPQLLARIVCVGLIVSVLLGTYHFRSTIDPDATAGGAATQTNTASSPVPGGVPVPAAPSAPSEALLVEVPDSNAPPENLPAHDFHRRVRAIGFRDVHSLRPPKEGNEREAARKFEFELFEDVQFSGRVTRMERHGPDRAVYSGELEDVPGDFILAYNRGAVAATFSTPTLGSYQIRSLGEGRHLAVELDPENLPTCETERLPKPEVSVPEHTLAERRARVAAHRIISQAYAPPPVEGSMYNGTGQQGGSGDELAFTEIDVMILHTAAATAEAGGNAGVEALIDVSLARANSAFINSGVGIRLRLVRVEEVSYIESNNNHELDLNNLKDGSGALSNAAMWRNQSGADLVSLFTTNPGGRAFLFDGEPDAPDFGFSVVGVAGVEVAFIHEIGHNLGLRHDRQNDNTANPLYPFSYGWRFTPAEGPELRTIMAYAPGQSIPYFSNPDITYMGTPTGVPIGEINQSHNAEALRLNTSTVAAFRSPTGNIPPSVNFEKPQHSDRFLALDTVDLQAAASDSDGSVQDVRFYRLKDDAVFGFSNHFSLPLGEDTTLPYSVSEIDTPAGFWTYAAVAFDNAGSFGVDTVSVAIAPHYRRYHYPLPPGKSRVEIEGINESGRFVGYGHSGNKNATNVQAAYWENGSITLLDPLPGDTGAKALALDADGAVFGESIDAGSNSRAVKWENSTNATDISDTIVGYPAERALGVDELGRVYFDSNDDYRRFDDPGSTTTGLNERWQKVTSNGQFAAGHDYTGSAFWAMRWDNGGNLLPPLAGSISSWGRATNRSGSVIGFSSPNPTSFHPNDNILTFWPAGSTTPLDLGTFGDPGGMAYDVNDFDHGVGTANHPASALSSLAFLWKGQGDLMDLNQLILPESGLLREAQAINNKGQIAGTGFVGADQVLFFLDPLPGLDSDYWLANYFSPSELTNPALTADTASPGGDGIPNLLKRALGIDPRLSVQDNPSEAEALPKLEVDQDGHVLYTIRRLRTPGTLTYSPQATLSLSDIDWDQTLLEIMDITPLDTDYEQVTLRSKSSLNDLGNLFLRLEITP